MELSDLRYACRLLGRSRTFTLTVLLLLALGIGVSMAVFAVARTVLWRSLPYAEPFPLVAFRSELSRVKGDTSHFLSGSGMRLSGNGECHLYARETA